MLNTMQRSSITEADARELLANHGIAAMVRKMGFFFPPGNEYGWDASPDAFVREIMAAVNERRFPRGPFRLDSVLKNGPQTASLIRELRQNEEGLRHRMVRRLSRYAPDGRPPQVSVYFVAGGSSDGFVLDDESEPAFYEALDKAMGDIAGVEQVLAHELYHVLQKSSGMRSPEYAAFVQHFEQQHPVQKLLATTLWEGTANFAADAREIEGDGPYIKLWRDRYVENETPHQRAQNFQLFDAILLDLAAGRITWLAAQESGFSDEQLYHVGMAMAGALAKESGANYFRDIFTRSPKTFFTDYIQLAEREPALPRFSQETVRLIRTIPEGWPEALATRRSQ